MNETVKTGKAPPRGKWPLFYTLKKGRFFEASPEHHAALRAKASRISRLLKRRFTVRKATTGAGKEVIRVYRED